MFTEQEINSRAYFRNKRSNKYYVIHRRSEFEFIVYLCSSRQYFDGLWESESIETLIGSFTNKQDALESMV